MFHRLILNLHREESVESGSKFTAQRNRSCRQSFTSAACEAFQPVVRLHHLQHDISRSFTNTIRSQLHFDLWPLARQKAQLVRKRLVPGCVAGVQSVGSVLPPARRVQPRGWGVELLSSSKYCFPRLMTLHCSRSRPPQALMEPSLLN